MKFLDFVSCCGNSRRASRSEETEIPAATEETRSLVIRSPVIRRRKRWRIAGSSAGQSSDWKPSLCSISENNDAVEKSDRRREDRTVGSERIVKRKSDRRRTNVVSHNDDYRRSSFPAVIPAFSPTPFMF